MKVALKVKSRGQLSPKFVTLRVHHEKHIHTKLHQITDQ